MKKIKFFSFIITSIILSCTVIFSAYAATYYVYDGYLYSKSSDGGNIIYGTKTQGTDIVFPDTLNNANVTEIGVMAFCDNNDLISVSFCEAKHLQRIGAFAFDGCKNLTKVTLSPYVTYLGQGAFTNCVNLENVDLNGAQISTIPNECFYGCSSLKTVALSSGVTAVEQNAFGGCSQLTEVYISNFVTYIADNAFANSPNITIYCSEGSYAESYAEKNGITAFVVDKTGDVDGDGLVTVTDGALIQKYIAHLEVFTEEQISHADVNNDGRVNIIDVTNIQKFLADVIPSLG